MLFNQRYGLPCQKTNEWEGANGVTTCPSSWSIILQGVVFLSFYIVFLCFVLCFVLFGFCLFFFFFCALVKIWDGGEFEWNWPQQDEIHNIRLQVRPVSVMEPRSLAATRMTRHHSWGSVVNTWNECSSSKQNEESVDKTIPLHTGVVIMNFPPLLISEVNRL